MSFHCIVWYCMVMYSIRFFCTASHCHVPLLQCAGELPRSASSHFHKWIIYKQKTWRGWLTILKFCKHFFLFAFRKKGQNNLFVSDPLHCENGIWNILIFAKYFHHEKCLAVLFWGYCSTRPHMLIFSQCSQQLTKVHRG